MCQFCFISCLIQSREVSLYIDEIFKFWLSVHPSHCRLCVSPIRAQSIIFELRRGNSSYFWINLVDVYLKIPVKTTVLAQLGGNAILKVEKSALGTLTWKRNGNLLSGDEPHYAYVNPKKTELKISNAGPEQAGVYKVFIKEGGCEKREEIKVQTGVYSLGIFLVSGSCDRSFM